MHNYFKSESKRISYRYMVDGVKKTGDAWFENMSAFDQFQVQMEMKHDWKFVDWWEWEDSEDDDEYDDCPEKRYWNDMATCAERFSY